MHAYHDPAPGPLDNGDPSNDPVVAERRVVGNMKRGNSEEITKKSVELDPETVTRNECMEEVQEVGGSKTMRTEDGVGVVGSLQEEGDQVMLVQELARENEDGILYENEEDHSKLLRDVTSSFRKKAAVCGAGACFVVFSARVPFCGVCPCAERLRVAEREVKARVHAQERP